MKSGSVTVRREAAVIATNSSGLSVGNRREVWPSRSVTVPSGSRNFTAMPRMSGARSGTSASPPAFDQRTSTGTGSPLRCLARPREDASDVAVNVPA